MKRILAAFGLLAALTACGSNIPEQNTGSQGYVLEELATPAEQQAIQKQIVYGTVSAVGSRPYQVAVLPSNRLTSAYCGGTLISSTWVLTAAHCVAGQTASSLRVRAGVYDISNTSYGQTVSISRIISHPSYSSASRGYDIALLKLSTTVTHPYAAPAALPGNTVESILDVNGKYAIVSGWGKTETGATSSKLREVSIPITPTGSDCGTRPANTICGKYDQGRDSCNGDSGGPLAQTYNSKWYVLGIVSYGPTECRGYGVYTRVNGYLNWIYQHTGIGAQ